MNEADSVAVWNMPGGRAGGESVTAAMMELSIGIRNQIRPTIRKCKKGEIVGTRDTVID